MDDGMCFSLQNTTATFCSANLLMSGVVSDAEWSKAWSFARFKGTMTLAAFGAALMFAVDILADVL